MAAEIGPRPSAHPDSDLVASGEVHAVLSIVRTILDGGPETSITPAATGGSIAVSPMGAAPSPADLAAIGAVGGPSPLGSDSSGPGHAEQAVSDDLVREVIREVTATEAGHDDINAANEIGQRDPLFGSALAGGSSGSFGGQAVSWEGGGGHFQDGTGSEPGGQSPGGYMPLPGDLVHAVIAAFDNETNHTDPTSSQNGSDGFFQRSMGPDFPMPGFLNFPMLGDEGDDLAGGRAGIQGGAMRSDSTDGTSAESEPAPPTQSTSTDGGKLVALRSGTGLDGQARDEAMANGAAVPPAVIEAEATDAVTSSQSAEPVEVALLDLPAPIGADLLLGVSGLKPAVWDAAVSQLVDGVDGMISELGELGCDMAYLPWVVGSGLAFAAVRAVRKSRDRPKSLLAYVDGTAVEPLPRR